ncbi:NAD(P)-binding protein [Gonapodya prolifera JEL478]|uniref:NAD(P)-binding protein n=1 Tax=Gonapodya prolifera (strain JEL478) TaxID=1344416 RepID=A0A139A6Q6_GONPJ|nr:NAD(P)-binding protein [Gonapodya prolifera JEL478]|eukprot:KXS12023.1 NAD(P)-binding protein [Gonapodya prolifera JEL478]
MSSLQDLVATLASKLDDVPTPWKIAAGVVGTSFLANRLYFSGGRNPYNGQQVRGKVAIVTGGNTGLGYETALVLARNGAEVVLACRDSQKTRDAVESIKKATGNTNVSAQTLELDSLASVRAFAKRWVDSKKPIHYLINNAGVMMIPKRTTTKDGFETQFGVNHLGHFLLTNLLLDIIESTAKTSSVRIVNLSSRASERGEIDWEDLMKEKPGAYNPQTVYNQSKLANVLFTKELQRRLSLSSPSADIIVTSLHPGVVRTELTRHVVDGPVMYLAYLFLFPLALTITKTPWEGAQTQLYCALAPSRKLVKGEYYADCAVKRHPKDVTRDPEAAKMFWAVSEKLVGLSA